MSASYYPTTMVDNCISRRQLGSCSVTRPFLSLCADISGHPYIWCTTVCHDNWPMNQSDCYLVLKNSVLYLPDPPSFLLGVLLRVWERDKYFPNQFMDLWRDNSVLIVLADKQPTPNVRLGNPLEADPETAVLHCS